MTRGDGPGSRRFTWIFAVATGLLALLFYREFILDGGAMLYGDDMINEGFQLRSFGVGEIRSGRGFPPRRRPGPRAPSRAARRAARP